MHFKSHLFICSSQQPSEASSISVTIPIFFLLIKTWGSVQLSYLPKAIKEK